jgi:hypothetical protein
LGLKKANEALTILTPDKGNVAMILGTSDHNRMISDFLKDKSYRKLKKDPTDYIERKTVLLLKKSPIAEEVYQQL